LETLLGKNAISSVRYKISIVLVAYFCIIRITFTAGSHSHAEERSSSNERQIQFHFFVKTGELASVSCKKKNEEALIFCQVKYNRDTNCNYCSKNGMEITALKGQMQRTFKKSVTQSLSPSTLLKRSTNRRNELGRQWFVDAHV
jgi:superfamily II DNA/RNA helicase